MGFLIGLPIVGGAYYESLKVRQEARREREGRLHSRNCLEFIAGDGTCINLVPLETLHSLPREGDVLMLPGDGIGEGGNFFPARTWWSRSSTFIRRLITRARAAARRG